MKHETLEALEASLWRTALVEFGYLPRAISVGGAIGPATFVYDYRGGVYRLLAPPPAAARAGQEGEGT